MIYKKPDKAIRWLRGESSQWGSDQEADILAFLDSLPDSFEIVPEGHVCVKLPDGITHQLLCNQETFIQGYFSSPQADLLASVIHSVATAIAPVEKKRKWNLWIIGGDPRPYAHPPEWTPSDSIGTGWRKVGECEVDA